MVWKLAAVLQQPFKCYFPIKCSSRSIALSYRIGGVDEFQPGPIPPLVILHGFFGHKKRWKPVSRTILNLTKRNVIYVDLRNHGKSPFTETMTYEEMANDVLKVFDKLKISKACLLGHSMGARVCMCIALMAPERVSGLVLVEISPVSTSSYVKKLYPKICEAMMSVNFKGIRSYNKARRIAFEALKKIIKHKILMKIVLSNIREHKNSFSWGCNIEIIHLYFPYLASFPRYLLQKQYLRPTVFIGGQKSEFIPPDDLPAIRRIFPRSVIRYIKDTGHYPQLEDPHTFHALLLAFLKIDTED